MHAASSDSQLILRPSKKRKRLDEDCGLTFIPPVKPAVPVIFASTSRSKRRRTQKPTIQYPVVPRKSLTTIHTPPSTPRRAVWTTGKSRFASPLCRLSSPGDHKVSQSLKAQSPIPFAQLLKGVSPLDEEGLYTFSKTPEPLTVIREESPDPHHIPQIERTPAEQRLDTHISVINAYYPAIVSQLAPPLPHSGQLSCAECQGKDPCLLFCDDCLDDRLYCATCMTKRHGNCPFHRVHKWTNGTKESTELSSHGLVLVLGHSDGRRCPSRRGIKTFQVLHSNGIHQMKIYRCECFLQEDSQRTVQQLLTSKLYPATSSNPSTLYTFEVLRLADRLQLDSYVAIKQFCDSMVRITPNEKSEVCQSTM